MSARCGLWAIVAVLLAGCGDVPRPETIAPGYQPDIGRLRSSIETDVSLDDRFISRTNKRLVALLQAARVLDARGKPIATAPGASNCAPGARGYCGYLIARVRVEGFRPVWQQKPQLDNGGHRVTYVRIRAKSVGALGASLAKSGMLSCLSESGAPISWRGAETLAYTPYVTEYDGGSAIGGGDCPVTKTNGNLQTAASFLQTGRSFATKNGYTSVR